MRSHRRAHPSPSGLLAAAAAGVLAFGLPALTQSAQAEDTQPVVVSNGNFAAPVVTSGDSKAGVDDWTGSTGVYSAARAKHPLNYQAAALNWANKPISLTTRLRGVEAGSTVTVSWDDSTDNTPSCPADIVNSGATYTVSVDGARNKPQAFSTNAKQTWFQGRIYRFTAAEDAPLFTFTSTETRGGGECGAWVANVAAKETAAVISTDPCAPNPSDAACKVTGANQAAIDKCPPSNRSCLQSVAGDGREEKDGIANGKQTLTAFTDKPRSDTPNSAVSELCSIPNALTENVKPGDAPVPPSSWWVC